MENWTNWADYMEKEHAEKPQTFESFIDTLVDVYAEYTPEMAAKETGVDAEQIVRVAEIIGKAGSRVASHNWRSAGSGNLRWLVRGEGASFYQCYYGSCWRRRWNFSQFLEQIQAFFF